MFRKLFFLSFVLIFSSQSNAQDTLILLNGKVIPVLNVDLQDYKIAYRKINKDLNNQALTETPGTKNKKTKLKTIDPYRVFSVKYSNGTERIIYQPDSLDPLEFTQEQMRLFIVGEQDAAKYYRNQLNKGIGFGLGAGAGLLGFYGLAGPPLYATIMGSFTPNLSTRLKKQNRVQTTKAVLDQLVKPVVPSQTENSAEELNLYHSSLKKYNSAEADYNKALKNQHKHIYFSNTDLMQKAEYREGYEKKARDRKIRNTMLSGLAGFIVLVFALPIIY